MNLEQQRMNEHFYQPISRLLDNAERDVRLSRADGDQAATARAQARSETLQAALEIYAAAHKWAYAERPWPRPDRSAKP